MFDLGRRLLLEISSRPIEVLVGICLFATAASGGSMASVASSSMAILFIVSLFYVKQWSELWYALSRNEKLLLAGLSMYAFTGLISYFNSSDEYEFVKHMGRYVRFLFVVPIYLLMTRNNMQLLKYLVAGAIFSGPFNLAVALISIAEWPEIPASGYYHWITFGDAAMLSVVFLSAILLTGKTGAIMKAMIIISIICAFYASILSQSRGAWLALPVCLLILTYIMIRYGELRNRLKIILPTLLLIVAVIGTSPIRDLIEN
ncbi:MAG: hypothetical protein OEZ38_13495, partial [Gammaproteobacteria bacterium]|nr:hypothetical protein [Gammaproteobacteria bacterium]